jgi:hypothetical protein
MAERAVGPIGCPKFAQQLDDEPPNPAKRLLEGDD